MPPATRRALILLAGAVLRFVPIWFGLPYPQARPDEEVAIGGRRSHDDMVVPPSSSDRLQSRSAWQSAAVTPCSSAPFCAGVRTSPNRQMWSKMPGIWLMAQ